MNTNGSTTSTNGTNTAMASTSNTNGNSTSIATTTDQSYDSRPFVDNDTTNLTSSSSSSNTTNGSSTNDLSMVSSAAAAADAILSNLTIETDDIKLYDITPMDYCSKSQSALSKSQIFRDELWRRRHTQTLSNSAGGCASNGGIASGSGSSSSSSESVDIETVLTRNMNQEDLRRLIEHQMVEAIKLTRMWSYKRESDSNDESQTQSQRDTVDELDSFETSLNKSWVASVDLSVRHTLDFPRERRRRSETKVLKKKKDKKSKSDKKSKDRKSSYKKSKKSRRVSL